MEGFDFETDDMMSQINDSGETTFGDSTGTYGSSSSPFGSGFDEKHPMPSYEELRNKGFSENIAHRIADGCSPASEKELFHILHESDNPASAYNDMMEAKAQEQIKKADELIKDVENSGLLGNPGVNESDTSHYNESDHNKGIQLDSKEKNTLGSCDCRSECKYNTGETYKSSNYGYSD